MSIAQPGSPPLGWPDPTTTFGGAVRRGYRQYVGFGGRASRAEFWYFYLFFAGMMLILTLPLIAIGVATNSQGSGLGPIPALGLGLAGLFYLGTLLPMLSAAVRRLHDAGYSGLFLLLGLVIGLVPFIMCMLPTSPAAARFGPPGPTAFPGQPQPYGGFAPGQAQPYAVPPAYGYPAQPGPPSGYAGPPPQGYGGAPAYPPQAPHAQPDQPWQGQPPRD